MRRAFLAVLFSAGAALAGSSVDPSGDAVLRPTDGGADAPVIDPTNPPDLVGLEVSGWIAPDPVGDRYTGAVDTSESPDLLRIAVTFDGLVSPPGPLGLSGLPYDPTRFGPTPVFGFIEFNIDDEVDSGGESRAVALNRYLANAARFGSIPAEEDPDRFVTWPGQTDSDFESDPQFERTGAEFAVAMCGCWDLSVLDEGGPADGVFDAGDTWLVSGRFLERAQGFDCLSLIFGNAGDGGPSVLGHYDPVTEARFSHDVQADVTTLEIVFPITPAGAAMLTGEAVQPIDFTFGGGNHFSIEEALTDLVIGAETATGTCEELAGDWYETDLHPPAGFPVRPLDPSTWTARVIIGTAYTQRQPDATYVWTDVAFGSVFGDVDGDGTADTGDADEIGSQIQSLDGSPIDADGQVDGRITLAGFGPGFSLYDLDYDGVVGPSDIALLGGSCGADLAEPFGVLDLADIAAFVMAFTGQDLIADMNGDGVLDLADITAFLEAFMHGCS